MRGNLPPYEDITLQTKAYSYYHHDVSWINNLPSNRLPCACIHMGMNMSTGFAELAS